ncbi:PKD domain-containing protein [Geofilum rhodophaeum]|uniref:PKD domain-containing protein n=1 Tax=Geofilum rhodophaeum TaxID=1965019 RepID=UPI00131419FE|nr:PKD domain-containing protein [Geofilum rhodophaeum]
MAAKILLSLFLLLAAVPILPAQEISLRKLPVGTPWSDEMAPLVQDSTLYFVSNRKSAWMVNRTDQNEQPLYKVYRATIDKKGRIGHPQPYELFSSEQLTVGPLSFSADGQKVVATLNTARTPHQDPEPNRLGLFEAHKQNQNWSSFKAIEMAVGSASIGHPCLSPDGQQLYFSAELPGGEGGKDLWVSQRTESGWAAPQNLGPAINTPGDEVFPQMTAAGRLYFSSNGHAGLGGMDLYYSEESRGTWGRPTPLPAPINSAFDDFSGFVLSGETSGYFASNREGRDRLYQFEYELSFCEKAQEVVEDQYCFTFFEDSPFDSDTLPHRYIWEFSDGGREIGAEVDYCFAGPGFYEIILSVQDSLSGEELYEVASYELLLEETRQVYITVPASPDARSEIILQAELRGFGDVKDVRYFWDFGPGTKKQTGSTIRHSFGKGTHTIRCEAYWDNQRWCSYRIINVE